MQDLWDALWEKTESLWNCCAKSLDRAEGPIVTSRSISEFVSYVQLVWPCSSKVAHWVAENDDVLLTRGVGDRQTAHL